MKTPFYPQDWQDLGDHFKRARQDRGWTPTELAREAGYSNLNKGRRRIHDLERGGERNRPVLDRFAHVLEIDLDQLFDELKAQADRRRLDDEPPRVLGELVRRVRAEAGVELDGLEPGLQRRIRRIEDGRIRFPLDDQLDELAELFDADAALMRQARDKEYDAYERLHGLPTLIMRVMAAVYWRRQFPEGLSLREVVDYAHQRSADSGYKIALHVSTRKTIYIEPDGFHFESFNAPYMSIG